MQRIQHWIAVIFSFYFAQAGCALSVFLMFLLVRSGAAANIVIGGVCALFCAMVIFGLGLVTSLSVGPDNPHLAYASIPGFALLYGTAHLLLGHAPGAGFFVALLAVSLAHLAIIWIGWHVLGRDLAVA
jgi:hypothetical protein